MDNSVKSATKGETDLRKQLFYVTVNHLLAEGGERENAIVVHDLGDEAHGLAVCYPNRPAILSQVQINILKEAVERYEIAVPETSGIYQEPDPLSAAKAQFPQFQAIKDRATGSIKLIRERARFAVNVTGPYVKSEPVKG